MWDRIWRNTPNFHQLRAGWTVLLAALRFSLPNPSALRPRLSLHQDSSDKWQQATRKEKHFTPRRTALTSSPASCGSDEERRRSQHRSHTPLAACTHPPPQLQRRSSLSAVPVGLCSRPRNLRRGEKHRNVIGTVTEEEEEEEEEKSVWVLLQLVRKGVKVVRYV
ncbi:hypothetical protein E2C01_000654 [Portunus trituberculatus]|uniref:Uncharacterized protein n=1 Tax=Portunus trituberculatus TaxID=210409 RepID=A0A5B7CEP1_PORTR|nr:hypothetical protein [Portunus trituberculatus]